ncbi:MAG: DoxX family protein [Candidatus Marinimicrobia bacterium]|jgi:putative oxidoreductase|nr:DoxX family protein [Candidatus Neomarinimicrobiota bacterium]MBT4149790.1 DoxX family protein [Candidatus Neomarinimicrobiota bacterium]MBT4317776.1 DoxX family protein [Candidatus Neomarinimicrobiota bacterium]MBT4783966.1 DoxX family protein [Candidatus Neomarinimicrobiota bacterium]MBT5096470.1 DoxX family protein [Candidatus Neomarinimicrobiota bacterium]
MKKIIIFITENQKSKDLGLLLLRLLPGYYFIANHGWSKITNPAKWEKLGNAFTKYFGELLVFANPFFGFLAAFSESICAILIFMGLFTRSSSFLALATMFIAAFNHITTTGSPEKAWLYFSIFFAIMLLGPGKYSLDNIFFSSAED